MNLIEKFFDFINGNNVDTNKQTNTVTNENEKSNNTRKCIMMSNINDFRIENGVLKRYYGKDEIVVIPDGVESIGESAFKDCTSLKSITIPDSVEKIGNRAFSGCESLKSITIPDGVKNIGWLAFSNCRSIESVTIPDSVTSIGDGAFSCGSLNDIYFKGSKEQWEKIDICSIDNKDSVIYDLYSSGVTVHFDAK